MLHSIHDYNGKKIAMIDDKTLRVEVKEHGTYYSGYVDIGHPFTIRRCDSVTSIIINPFSEAGYMVETKPT